MDRIFESRKCDGFPKGNMRFLTTESIWEITRLSKVFMSALESLLV